MPTLCPVLDDPRMPSATTALLERELLGSPYWSIRQLRCDWRDGQIVIRGNVTSFYMKQLAVAVAAKAVGVGRVQIEVNVRPE